MLLSPTLFKNPINQTKSTDAADAFDKPILTLGSLRRGVTNVQTNGLPTDNKTTLGLYRFPGGDIGPLSGGVGQPAVPPVPFNPQPKPVMFATTGNNVWQPDKTSASLATNALLKRVGEQQFKAKENEPYAAYMAMAKLEREVAEAEKGASVGDLNLAREILRDAVAQRRKQNEDDYLRKMLDSGLSVEDAQDELDEVRRANALQESRKVDDRSYQAKLLLVNLAKRRGITANVNEPLTQSAPIMNPSPSDAMATAMGDASQGFGNAPLDVNRQFLTPEYYRRFLRKSRITDEDTDRQMAMNNLVAQGAAGEIDTPLILDARRREIAMENVAESLAQSLTGIRQRALVEPLPPPIFAGEVYEKILSFINKKPYQSARMVERDFTSMNEAQLVVAINRLLAEGGRENVIMLEEFFQDLPAGELNEKGEPKSPRDLLLRVATMLTVLDNSKTIGILVPFKITPVEMKAIIRVFRGDALNKKTSMIERWVKMFDATAERLAAEPKKKSEPTSDKKKTMYFASTGVVESPAQTISREYGISPEDAEAAAKVINRAVRNEIGIEQARKELQKRLSMKRAIELLQRFVAAQNERREVARESLPIPKSRNAYDKLSSDKKDEYKDAYKIPRGLSRREQYEYLVANFRA